MQKIILLLILIFFFAQCKKEEDTTKIITIKGKVIDKKTKLGLSNVTIRASTGAPCTGGFGSLGFGSGSNSNLNAITTNEGNFQLTLTLNKNFNTVQWYILPEKEYYEYSESSCERFEVGLNFDDTKEVVWELNFNENISSFRYELYAQNSLNLPDPDSLIIDKLYNKFYNNLKESFLFTGIGAPEYKYQFKKNNYKNSFLISSGFAKKNTYIFKEYQFSEGNNIKNVKDSILSKPYTVTRDTIFY